MSIDYELQDGVSETAVLEVWPKDTLADTDRRLLSTLADTLDAALEDAIDAEVEDNGTTQMCLQLPPTGRIGIGRAFFPLCGSSPRFGAD